VKTNIWLKDLLQQLGWEDHARAYHALAAVLHALRDRLSPEEATDLGAQLPMLLRGAYYEGWTVRNRRVLDRKKQDFLAHIAAAFRGDERVNAEQVARAVFKVIAQHVTAGEIEDVKAGLPADVRSLWP
jgi:uncharacterized protein (DUF2267 family)